MDKILSNDKIISSINKYLNSKDKNTNLELEYKIYFAKDTFINILKLMIESFSEKDKVELEQSTNIIYKIDNKSNYVFQKIYGNAKEKGKFYPDVINKYIKKKLLTTKLSQFKNIKLDISYETKEILNLNTDYFIRYKNRLSFPIGEWRYDFTQTYHFNPVSPSKEIIQKTGNSLFLDIKEFYYNKKELLDKYLISCNNSIITNYEIEVEYIGNLKGQVEDVINNNSFLDGFNNQIKEYLYYEYILYQIANKLGVRNSGSIKSMLPKVTGLDKKTYNNIYPPVDYYISYKADGDRCLIVVYDDGSKILVYSNQYKLLNGEILNNKISTIIECEYLITKNVLLAYDICVSPNELQGSSISNLGIRDRLNELSLVISDLSKEFKDLGIKLLLKKWYLITDDLHRSFKAVIDDKFLYPEDGYILIEPGKDYFNTLSYKIKINNTIDFLAVKIPEKYYGVEPYKIIDGMQLYLLFNGINTYELEKIMLDKLPCWDLLFKNIKFKDYIPIQFSPPDFPLAYLWYVDKKTDKLLDESKNDKGYVFVELLPTNFQLLDSQSESDFAKQNHKLDSKKSNLGRVHPGLGAWKLEKIRTDRNNEPNYWGNNFIGVGNPTWLINQDPIKIENMHLPVSTYFKKGKNNIYMAQTAANSFIKYKLIEQASSLNQDERVVIDLAAGKGQDLNRYIKLNYKKGLFIDIDKIALTELISRWYEIVRNRKKSTKFKVSILNQDLTLPSTEILARIGSILDEDDYPNLIVCNFAIHYFTKDIGQLQNLILVIDKLLKTGGKFLFTTFSGQAVLDLIESDGNGEEWIAKENERVKYNIVKQFKSKKLEMFSQYIKVKLPFLDDEFYEEQLVNIDFYNTVFEKYGFNIVKTGSFKEFLPLFKNENPEIYKLLTEDDKKMVSIYSYSILSNKLTN